MFDIKEELKKLPDSPGVYIHKDEFGQVIYVGKAISLKKRVRQYFQSSDNQTPKTRELVKHIKEFEYINAGSEMEALILECNLIKKYRPKYNILLRDDKTYPYIKLTLSEDYPRLIKSRKAENDKAKYFGPFASDWATGKIIRMLNESFHLKRCSELTFSKNHKPCLNYHIGECMAPCINNISKEEYKKNIDLVVSFLSGKDKSIKKELENKMAAASEELRFEDAAKYRDLLKAIDTIFEKQRVVLSNPENIDIIYILTSLSGSYALLFTVREGKLSGRESFYLGNDGQDKETLLSEYIKQYYFENPFIPKEILVSLLPKDIDLLSEFLANQRGSKVKVYVPKKGEKKSLFDVIKKDAYIMLSDIDEINKRETEKEDKIQRELALIFGNELASNIHRIESFDISNLNGLDSVAGMVVFSDGRPIRKDYRKFKIKTVEGPDDTGSMMEVLYRRYKRAKDKDPGFSTLPDIIFMDGGAGQVSAAKDVLSALSLDIPVAGMVKDDKHRTRALLWNGIEYPLKDYPSLFSYCGAIQEEVHRFSIDYHHAIREKALKKSVLDDIKGIGEKRKNALLKKFGSIENIKKASYEDILKTDGFNEKVAEELINYFSKKD